MNRSDPRPFFAKVHFRVMCFFRSFAKHFRIRWYRALGAKIDQSAKLGNIHINWPHQVSIGARTEVEDGVAIIHHTCMDPGPNIIIGDDTYIGHGSLFTIKKGITIGRKCMFAAGCHFVDNHHVFADLNVPMRDQDSYGETIQIEDDVWLGSFVTILKGVKIGEGAVVGAGAVVTKSVPALEIWAGVPARKIGDRRVLARAAD